jgi:predicted ester cyclase
MSEANDYREKIERLYEGLMAGDLSVVDNLVHEEYEYHRLPPIPTGPEGMRVIFQMVKDGWSDVRFVIDDFMVDGDRAISRYRIIATHTGVFAGAPATGNHLDYTGIAIYRFRNGLIIEEWDQYEEAKFYTGLGLLPSLQRSE